MRTLAVLPIKSFDAAKQRLGGVLAAGARQALARAMFADVLAALRRTQSIDAIAVVTGDRRAQSAAVGSGVSVIHDALDAGHPGAAALGVRRALAEGYDRALLVPGDVPLIDPQELRELLARTEAEGVAVAVVPDRHETGTNGLVLAPADAIPPSFGPGSLERHLSLARDAGVSRRVERVPSLMHDVDTPDDLADLWTALDGRRGLAGNTRGTLRQLDRVKAFAVAVH